LLAIGIIPQTKTDTFADGVENGGKPEQEAVRT